MRVTKPWQIVFSVGTAKRSLGVYVLRGEAEQDAFRYQRLMRNGKVEVVFVGHEGES